ncbi:MAG: methionine--tRNA ligase [Candidatus Nealsonbacteria bacterium]|nr:MAG: methionine--tRNA ligase [Candidatus Nealsonbacteria bacterium]
MAKKKFYITTSIAYTNAPPHIGFALEVIQADVLARYHRFLGEDVFFLTGTDEHGTKIAKAACEAGKKPREFVDDISKKFQNLKTVLNLSNDDFIRTTDEKRHRPAVEKVWRKLKENNDIYKKKYRGLYCVGCESFISKKDLVDGKCPYHQKKPEVIKEENYFFKLSKYSKKIGKIIERDEIKIISKARKNEILSLIKQGIEDISCSRLKERLLWGIPVPDDNTQTIYVWVEALINYISALGYAKEGNKFKKFWPADIHCIGKDIIKFHSLLWPAILISLDLELPKTIFIHGFITVGGQKMSKSLGTFIDPFELVKQYGADAIRYFLLREILPTEDGDFTYEKLEDRYNADLAKGIGNLVSRVLTLAEKSGFKLESLKIKQIQDSEFQTEIDKTWQKHNKALNEFKFNTALISIWELIAFCDQYIEKEKLWEKKGQKEDILYLLYTLENIARMLKPFIPETSEKILCQLGIKSNDKEYVFNVEKKEPLFPKLNSK